MTDEKTDAENEKTDAEKADEIIEKRLALLYEAMQIEKEAKEAYEKLVNQPEIMKALAIWHIRAEESKTQIRTLGSIFAIRSFRA